MHDRDTPFHTIHTDHVGLLTKVKEKCILVIIDTFTKFVTLSAVRSTKSSEIIKQIKNLIGCFGTHTHIITDRVICFTSY